MSAVSPPLWGPRSKSERERDPESGSTFFLLTLYRDNELRDDGEDLLGAALGEEVVDPVDGEEDVRVLIFPQTVEEEREVEVIVEGLEGNLEVYEEGESSISVAGSRSSGHWWIKNW